MPLSNEPGCGLSRVAGNCASGTIAAGWILAAFRLVPTITKFWWGSAQRSVTFVPACGKLATGYSPLAPVSTLHPGWSR